MAFSDHLKPVIDREANPVLPEARSISEAQRSPREIVISFPQEMYADAYAIRAKLAACDSGKP